MSQLECLTLVSFFAFIGIGNLSSSSPESRNVAQRGRSNIKFRAPEETSVVIALLALIGFVGILRPNFLQMNNLLNLGASYAITALLAAGLVYLLALGEIDLSFGWILNFSAVIAGLSMISGIPVWISVLIGVLSGAAMGFLNGVLSVVMRLPLIIVTLGTASVYQGTSLISNRSGSVVPPIEITDQFFFRFFGGVIDTPIPFLLVIVILVIILLHLILHKTRFGYRVLAIGSNVEAARLAGIPIKKIKIQVSMLMGGIAGLGGVLFLGFRGAVDPTTGAQVLLPVVAAAIIGGTPLSGGSGTVIGALYGALIVGVIGVGVVFLGIDAVWSTLFTGLVIIIAIGIDQLVRIRRKRT